ncbi:JAB domain-containing protein [Staphylococcus chromogenes]|uniref:JAB domain-containing protein n=1 Tax=Staphylococcus chromogenes TaxID=46126 RepID=UPI0013008F36
MNSKNEPALIKTILIVTIRFTIISPRKIFKTIILSNTTSIIVAHNYPSVEVSLSL